MILTMETPKTDFMHVPVLVGEVLAQFEFPGDALNTREVDFAVGDAVAIEHATSSPGKVAATWRIAGAKLHAVESLAVVGRG